MRRVLVLCGPTGVGKTDMAVALAQRHNLEIISADSRQVYKLLDIGTAKPSAAIRCKVPIHLVDMVLPGQAYSAADYAHDALALMRRLSNEGKSFIVVGGAGFYLRALFQPFFAAPKPDPALRAPLMARPVAELYARLRQVDPDRAVRLHPNDRQRIVRALEVYEQTGKTMSSLYREMARSCEFCPVYVVLTMPRQLLYQRINERFDAMLAAGLLDEVRRLATAGYGNAAGVADAYGYAELLDYLAGKLSLQQAVAQAKTRSRAYARRQLTWFRALPGAEWIDCSDVDSALTRVEESLLLLMAGLT